MILILATGAGLGLILGLYLGFHLGHVDRDTERAICLSPLLVWSPSDWCGQCGMARPPQREGAPVK